jgi:hypothetical protein
MKYALPLVLLLCGCGQTKQIEVLPITVERPRPPMPAQCYKDGLEAFKPVAKTAGDKTPSEATLQALQSNKRRMASNADRAGLCECFIALETKNESDLARLAGRCDGQPASPAKDPLDANARNPGSRVQSAKSG